jgi:hypothetical protein
MKRRDGLRARTDIGVVARDGNLVSHCRGIELSAGGIVLDRGRPVTARDDRIFLQLELRLPEHFRPIVTWARPIWASGHRQALKFLRVSDADRLSLAEHLDLLALKGAELH